MIPVDVWGNGTVEKIFLPNFMYFLNSLQKRLHAICINNFWGEIIIMTFYQACVHFMAADVD